MPLPDPIREVLTVFRPLFTAPTWRKLMTLLTGTLLAQGRCTVVANRLGGKAKCTTSLIDTNVCSRSFWWC